DLVTHRHAAGLDGEIPFEAPVLAVDAGAGADAAAAVAPRVLDRGRQRLDLQGDRSRDAADGELPGDAQIAGRPRGRLHARRPERHGRVTRDVEEVGAAQVLVPLRLARIDAARVDADVHARARRVLLVDEHRSGDRAQVS